MTVEDSGLRRMFSLKLAVLLGAGTRLVDSQDARICSSLGCFLASGLCGLAGLRPRWLVMRLNWGRVFLDGPRWRIPLAFAMVGVRLQTGLIRLNQPALTSLAKAGVAAALLSTAAGGQTAALNALRFRKE